MSDGEMVDWKARDVAFLVYGDSQVVVDKLRAEGAGITHPAHQRIFDEIRGACDEIWNAITFEHRYRDQNEIADALANRALDTQGSGCSFPAYRIVPRVDLARVVPLSSQLRSSRSRAYGM